MVILRKGSKLLISIRNDWDAVFEYDGELNCINNLNYFYRNYLKILN